MKVFIGLLLCAFAFLLQALLGFFQVKNFSKSFLKMKKNGKVVIGKNPKKLRAGTILLLNIDKNANIMNAELMKGRTIFARFKVYHPLENKSLPLLATSYDELQKYDPLVRECILNAYGNYISYKTGKIKGLDSNRNSSFFSLPMFEMWKNIAISKIKSFRNKIKGKSY